MTAFPIARRMVLDQLGHLFRPGAQIGSHHMGPLEHFMYRLWVRGGASDWCQAVAASNSLLERAFDEHTSTFGPIWNELADAAGAALVGVNRIAPSAWSSGTAVVYSCSLPFVYTLRSLLIVVGMLLALLRGGRTLVAWLVVPLTHLSLCSSFL